MHSNDIQSVEKNDSFVSCYIYVFVSLWNISCVLRFTCVMAKAHTHTQTKITRLRTIASQPNPETKKKQKHSYHPKNAMRNNIAFVFNSSQIKSHEWYLYICFIYITGILYCYVCVVFSPLFIRLVQMHLPDDRNG